MERLIKRKLWNAGLVRLTPHLVERYNECLISMGLPPTQQSEIDIDGAGVSPQMAKELGDPHYLCNGMANPLAIIVSPDQYDKPVFAPIFSWMRPLLRAVFDKNPKSIRDITGTHPIGIDLEDGISAFRGVEDLLLLTEVTAVPHIEDLAAAAEMQASLIAKFNDGPPADPSCLREEVCDALVIQRQAHGDLRRRKLDMYPITFDSFDDFHTVAFGGAAVLRHVDGDDLLIVEDREVYEQIDKRKLGSAKAFYLGDPDFTLFNRLRENKWVVVPAKRYKSDPKLLEYQKELLLADALCDCEAQLNWRGLASSARKALLIKHEDKVPAIYFELERYAANLKAGRAFTLSPELEHFLAVPSEKMPPETQHVLQILLTRREPRNLLALYKVDKNAFLARYEQWSDKKREWAVDYLAERYQHQHQLNQ